MWQKKQFEILTKEIEEALSPLSNSMELRNLAKEPLELPSWSLESKSGCNQPWPILPLVVCEAISGLYEQALPLAAALQFLKAAAEVFDDIEDADSSQALSKIYGNAIATNIATTLLILAEKTLTRLKNKGMRSDLVIRVIDSVNSYYTTACIGQHLDLSITPEVAGSEEMYLKVADMKSASVIECACHVGSMIASSDQGLIDKFTEFGHNLGMAAQIANDIQDITRGIDILKLKINFPVVYALTQTKGDIHQHLLSIFTRQTKSTDDFSGIRDLLFSTGAVHYAILKMELYKQQANEILSEMEINGINIERLKLFVV
jgi:geranylgeranyl pyrophosphate synthase